MAKNNRLPAGKTPVPAKKPASSTKKATAAPAAAEVPPKDLVVSATHQQQIALLPPGLMSAIKEEIQVLIDDFQKVSDNNLTALQRRRKIGAGIRNYGFIDKASDLAAANPRFAQFFDINDLKNAIRNIEACREIVIMAQTLARMVSNAMMVYSDDAFSMALIFYNILKEMSRRGDPEAMELFRALQPFFRRPRRTSAEPTAKELEHDLHALLHGKKDGKIVVENVSPKTTAGARKVVDDVHKGKAMVRESAEAEIDEGTSEYRK